MIRRTPLRPVVSAPRNAQPDPLGDAQPSRRRVAARGARSSALGREPAYARLQYSSALGLFVLICPRRANGFHRCASRDARLRKKEVETDLR